MIIQLLPIGGLCNRMVAIDSAIALARETGALLQVYWERNTFLFADFEQLFELIPDVSIISLPPGSLRFLPETGTYDIYNTSVFQYKKEALYINGQETRHKGNEVSEKVREYLAKNKPVILEAFWEFYSNSNAYSSFVPHHCIKEIISSQIAVFPKSIIGIHIRRTDHKWSILNSPSHLFKEAIRNELIKDPSVHFFVASDSAEEKQELIKEFGDCVITRNQLLTRKTEDGIREAVVDLWSLSQTKKIYGSHHSTFSSVAAEIGDIPLVIVQNNSTTMVNGFKKRNMKLNTCSPDRKVWLDLLSKIALPVLQPLSCHQLKQTMQSKYSPIWDDRNRDVVWLEAFGRTMAGVAPFLNLPEGDSDEGELITRFRGLCSQCYENAVDKKSPDYMLWEGEPQVLVDAAYLASSFIRSPEFTWNVLEEKTCMRYIEVFKNVRNIKPFNNNWILFRGIIEAFLITIDEGGDKELLQNIIRTINSWYIGDGWYKDGQGFAFDYYNSFVIHPFLVETLGLCKSEGVDTSLSFETAFQRMQRFNESLERMISPEATFPIIGRSITYRLGIFQSLALSAWRYRLPATLSSGQVRNALTHVMKRVFRSSDNFTEDGFLRLGLTGRQPGCVDYYTNTGSLYMTTLAFLPLGLSKDDIFWTAPAEKWTSLKAWSGDDFVMDKKRF